MSDRFKFFIRPKRRKAIESLIGTKGFSCEISVSERSCMLIKLPFLFALVGYSALCLHQAACFEIKPQQTGGNEQVSRLQASAADVELVRLAGDHVQLECPLEPARTRPLRSPLGVSTGGTGGHKGSAGRKWQVLNSPVIDGKRTRRRVAAGGGQREEEEEEEKEEASPEDETVEMILWYRDGSQQPIFSVDARRSHRQTVSQPDSTSQLVLVPMDTPIPALKSDGMKLNYLEANYNSGNNSGRDNSNLLLAGLLNAKQHALARLSGRLRLVMRGTSAYLIIDKLEANDAGAYKCRVDYKYARTRYQQSRLQVIAPVSKAKISAKTGSGIDLWPAAANEAAGSEPIDNNSWRVAGPIEQREDENLLLECQAKDGWPEPQVALWRVDWLESEDKKETEVEQGRGLAVRVTQLLSDGPNKLRAAANDSIATRKQLQSKSTRGYLINANTMMSGEEKQTSGHVYTSAYNVESNVTATSENNNLAWLEWMQNRLAESLSTQSENVSKGGANHLLKELMRAILKAQNGARTPLAKTNGGQLADMWRFLYQNQLVLYTCGLSNTRNSNKLILQQSANDAHWSSDKLAKVEPLFTSLLVQPIAPPKWVRMFLASRRSLASGKHIELTPLSNGQNLHLNLASYSTTQIGLEDRQLQLVCQTGGAMPRARLEWTSNSGDREQSKVTSLVSDSWIDSLDLIRAFSVTNGSNNNDDLENSDWSSLRVHNISVEEHQSVITCSAFNEKLLLSSANHDGSKNLSVGKTSKLGTSVRLNITHVPLVRLLLLSPPFPSPDTMDPLGYPINKKNLSNFERVVRQNGGQQPKTNGPDQGQGGDVAHGDGRLLVQTSRLRRGILFGENVTLLCVVDFANPSIKEPLEWSFNNSTANLTVDKSPWSSKGLNVLSMTRAISDNKQKLSERLIVQFHKSSHDDSSLLMLQPSPTTIGKQLQLKLEVKCSARNALGISNSNTLSLDAGHSPRCMNSSESDNHADVTDRYQLNVQCPVISDKDSSEYHWLLLSDSKTKQPKIALSSESATISLVQLNLTDETFDNGLEISCYASDRFGSNINDPCLIRINRDLLMKESARTNVYRNCAAELRQKIVLYKRQHLDVQSINQQMDSYSNKSSMITTTKPSWLLSLICNKDLTRQANNDNDEDILHFDLYNKQDGSLVQHLVSKPKSQASNISLILDFDNSNLKTSKDIEESYLITMSITDAYNQTKQANITLQFSNSLDLNNNTITSTKSQSANRSIRDETGQRDLVWFISSVVFTSSFALLIFVWLCRSNNSSLQNKTQGLSKKQYNEGQEVESQTEMYLVGKEPRPTVYHNNNTDNKQTARDQVLLQASRSQCKLRSSHAEPCDFLIIDPTPNNDNNNIVGGNNGYNNANFDSGSSQVSQRANNFSTPSRSHGEDETGSRKQAILLIDPHQPLLCATYEDYSPHQQSSSYLDQSSLGCEISGQYQEESMIQLHPIVSHSDAILRAPCQYNSESGNCYAMSLKDSSSTASSLTIRPGSRLNALELGKSCPMRSPVSLVTMTTANSPIGCNFELNSQGELTMTDESSSFVHEDRDGATSNVAINRCNLDGENWMMAVEPETQLLPGRMTNCLECRKSTLDLVLQDVNHHIITASGSFKSQSPSSSSQSSSVQQACVSTLKRGVKQSHTTNVRNERVRFVDYVYKN